MKNLDIPKILFLLSAAALIFCYGVAVPVFGLFPKKQLEFLRDSAIKVYNERFMLLGAKPVHLVQPARYEGAGVSQYAAGKAAPGLTFLASFFDDSLEMRLIRLDGSIVNRWPLRFGELFQDTGHIKPDENVPLTDWHTFVHGAVVLPDGSVVFNFEYHGLVKLDRCGAVVWRLPVMSHHSVDHSSDGGFWVPGRRYSEGDDRFPAAWAPYLEDTVLKVSAEGEILREISVPGLMLKNDMWPIVLATGLYEIHFHEPELVHLNDIEELMERDAAAFPPFAAGDLLLSLRELNMLMVIDPVTEIVKWYRIGPWLRQHDPDFQPDGTITVFNNRADDTKTGEMLGGSQVLAFDFGSGRSRKLQPADPKAGFYTELGGKHQVLPNGNVLVVEYESGRIVELDATGGVDWEYINRYDEDEVFEISTALRYPEGYFTVEDWSCK